MTKAQRLERKRPACNERRFAAKKPCAAQMSDKKQSV